MTKHPGTDLPFARRSSRRSRRRMAPNYADSRLRKVFCSPSVSGCPTCVAVRQPETPAPTALREGARRPPRRLHAVAGCLRALERLERRLRRRKFTPRRSASFKETRDPSASAKGENAACSPGCHARRESSLGADFPAHRSRESASQYLYRARRSQLRPTTRQATPLARHTGSC